jgi:phosphoribosylglycinamide formyltransferase-1
VNVHPSLLPAFPGVRAIQQALDYGVTIFGVTVHFVEDDGGVDTGPVILQRGIELPGASDPEEVHERLRPIEHALVPEAVRLIATGAVTRDPENPRRVRIAPAGAEEVGAEEVGAEEVDAEEVDAEEVDAEA